MMKSTQPVAWSAAAKIIEGKDRAGGKFRKRAEQPLEVRDRRVADQTFEIESAVIEQASRHGLSEVAVEQTDNRDGRDDPAPFAHRGIEAQGKKDEGEDKVGVIRQRRSAGRVSARNSAKDIPDHRRCSESPE